MDKNFAVAEFAVAEFAVAEFAVAELVEASKHRSPESLKHRTESQFLVWRRLTLVPILNM